MIPTQALLAIVLFAGATLIAARWLSDAAALRADQLLRHRSTPWVIGTVTALGFWWVAGSTLRVEPISTDEASYLLQAELFAHGRATAPPPPIVEFFEQAWVVTTPRIYSKYPPGHALALAPGVAMGLPWLIPLLLNILNGALLFALLRRAAGPATALLVWSAWVFSGMAMAWQTSYFSEVTLMACWLVAALALWRWTEAGARSWLVVCALALGYGALTRPLSILLLALPLAWPLVRSARAERRWRDVAWAGLAGAAMLATIPAWNLATTGRAARSPLTEYTETYLPWDRVGFAIDSTAPRRATPPDLRHIAHQLARVHREHTVARLPRTLWERGVRVGKILFTEWRLPLLLLALVGVWRLRGVSALAMGAVAAQFLGHAIWGHEAGWTIYYAESAALWFLPGALATVALIGWAIRRAGTGASEARLSAALLLAAPGLLALSIQDSATYRGWRAQRVTESRAFREFTERGPTPAIYFVRYPETGGARAALVRNSPFLDRSTIWVVYDLGSRNAELLRAAPDRRGFLVDVGSGAVTPIESPR